MSTDPNPGKYFRYRTDRTAPIRYHDLRHTDLPGISIDFQVRIGDLSNACAININYNVSGTYTL